MRTIEELIEPREIEFRAKRLDNGKWMYGTYWHDTTGKYWMQPDCKAISYQIDPKTIGQFTGMYDRKKKKIFEGDLLRPSGAHSHAWVVKWFYNGWVMQNVTDFRHYVTGLKGSCDVIGHIHQSPRTVKKKIQKVYA